MPILRTPLACLLTSVLSLSVATLAPAQTLEQSENGKFLVNTLETPWGGTAYKGVLVKFGKEDEAAICFDTELLRMTGGWLKRDPSAQKQPQAKPGAKAESPKPAGTGWYALFDPRSNTAFTASHGRALLATGDRVFATKQGPGWGDKFGALDDPRELAEDGKSRLGPLPKAWGHWKGLYRNGDDVVLSYTVGMTDVLEVPGTIGSGRDLAFTRTIRLGKSDGPQTLVAFDLDGSSENAVRDSVASATKGDVTTFAGMVKPPAGVAWATENGRATLKLPARAEPVLFKIVLWSGPKADADEFAKVLPTADDVADPATLIKGGPARWGEGIAAVGRLATSTTPDGAYAVDAITGPDENPWKALPRFAGLDFFEDGKSAALSTIGGDVWVVTGIDEKLQRLAWKRFATGLYQPLGLKIVDGKVHTIGRDQITRLHDLNNDGEADFYENVNNDSQVTDNYHEFCLDLQTDTDGNFYYPKGSPWPPDVKSRDQGTMIVVSKDGSKFETFATGLRAPNGTGMSEDNVLTASDNQGHWEPSSKVSWIRRGKFYGMVPAAHMPGKSKPTDFEQPIFWLPQNMDNSSGGQAFAPKGSDRWGPLAGRMVHLSYGKSTLFACPTETVDGAMQGAAIQFPLKFDSSAMRARFHSGKNGDGQLYLCGLKGWQTNAGKEGALHRVRYTGKPSTIPVDVKAHKNGVAISYAVALDKATATDAENWSVEQWNYQWTANYGSPEVSVRDPKKKGHDEVDVKGATLSADGKTVFLRIDGMTPVHQMKITSAVRTADGQDVKYEIYNTIHKLRAEQKDLTAAK